MRFEKPAMSIEMFDMESVTTNASAVSAIDKAGARADELITDVQNKGGTTAKITIEF